MRLAANPQPSSATMSILCRCNSCHTRFRVKNEMAGSKARCAKCGHVFRIPAVNDSADDGPRSTGQPAPSSTSSDVTSPEEEAPILAEAIESPPSAPPLSPTATQVPIGPQVTGSPPLAAPLAHPVTPAASQPTATPLPQATPIQSSLPIAAPLTTNSISITTDTPRTRRKREPRISTALVSMAFIASCLILIAALFFFLQSRGPKMAILRVDIPDILRDDCAVIVDGNSQHLSPNLPLEFDIERGQHRVSLRRIGFERVDYDLDVQGAEIVDLAPTWIPKRETPPHNTTESTDSSPQEVEIPGSTI